MVVDPNSKSNTWLRRVLTALPWFVAVLLLAAAGYVAGTLPAGPTLDSQADWATAAERVDRRLGPSEVVVVHRAGQVVNAQPLNGLPLICDEGGRKASIGGSRRDGLWILGDRKLSKRLVQAWRALPKHGTIQFGTVFLHHGWRPPKEER